MISEVCIHNLSPTNCGLYVIRNRVWSLFLHSLCLLCHFEHGCGTVNVCGYTRFPHLMRYPSNFINPFSLLIYKYYDMTFSYNEVFYAHSPVLALFSRFPDFIQ